MGSISLIVLIEEDPVSGIVNVTVCLHASP
jgi:hypothetical protein